MARRPTGKVREKFSVLSALNTDLYELTMAACYWERGMNQQATFSLFVRDYPAWRRYYVAAGLADAVEFLLKMSFSSEELAYLESLKMFRPEFLFFLEKLRFRGDVRAIPEGRLFFADEPVLEVEAPLIEAQLVETMLLNILHFEVLVATKASRCFQAAQGRQLIDFSLRRTHGLDAGLKVARASYIAGFAGTSNVMAGRLYGLPVYGTMAHSFVSSFDREVEAFRAYAAAFPEKTVLLIDTYDTLAGARKAVEVGLEMARKGEKLSGVRLDSGQIAPLSKAVRRILDNAGLKDTRILASGAFDEYKIIEVTEKGALVNAFGVGTKMGVSADVAYLDMAYKMVEYAGREVLKLSPGKTTLVAGKQVWRFYDKGGKFRHDIISLKEESVRGGEPLLQPVLEKGRLIKPLPSLTESHTTFRDDFARLPEKYKALSPSGSFYPVRLSPGLRRRQKKMVNRVKRKELGES